MVSATNPITNAVASRAAVPERSGALNSNLSSRVAAIRPPERQTVVVRSPRVVNPLTRRPLSEWTLHHAGGETPVPVADVPATVPGCVHTDLLEAGLIPDPF